MRKTVVRRYDVKYPPIETVIDRCISKGTKVRVWLVVEEKKLSTLTGETVKFMDSRVTATKGQLCYVDDTKDTVGLCTGGEVFRSFKKSEIGRICDVAPKDRSAMVLYAGEDVFDPQYNLSPNKVLVNGKFELVPDSYNVTRCTQLTDGEFITDVDRKTGEMLIKYLTGVYMRGPSLRGCLRGKID